MSSIVKLGFLGELAWKRLIGRGLACPNCGSCDHETEDRKFVIAELRRCGACKLLYRAPADSSRESDAFYQTNYTEGFTTELPDEATLKALFESKFADSEKSYADYIRVLSALGIKCGDRVFDYGCSWGYGSWQLAQAGLTLSAFEISRRRAEFAREKLGVNCTAVLPRAEALGEAAHSFDMFFSAHVLEHVPSPREVIELATTLVKPGGLFLAFTPNGSAQYRAVNPTGWHTMWGKAHPNVLDDRYYRAAFSGRRVHFDTSPADEARLKAFTSGANVETPRLLHSELLCVVQL
jgi:2-polyprenyl-3-methyl-5-hydroxy-6-metoxy-1,4-benzoquinol methylase